MLLFVALLYNLSPWILLTNCTSFSIMVTHLACMAHKFVSSNNRTRYTSAASCNALTTAGDTLNISPPCCISCTISLTKWSKGALLISSSVVLWHFLISRKCNSTWPVSPGLLAICPWFFTSSSPSLCSCCCCHSCCILRQHWCS